MTAPTVTIPANLDPATIRRVGDQVVYAETCDGRYGIQAGEDGWTVVPLAGGPWHLYEPSLEAAAGGCASGRIGRCIEAAKARRAERLRAPRALELARAWNAAVFGPPSAEITQALVAEIERLDQVVAALCRRPEADAAVADDDQLVEAVATGGAPDGADPVTSVLAAWATESQGGEPR